MSPLRYIDIRVTAKTFEKIQKNVAAKSRKIVYAKYCKCKRSSDLGKLKFTF